MTITKKCLELGIYKNLYKIAVTIESGQHSKIANSLLIANFKLYYLFNCVFCLQVM